MTNLFTPQLKSVFSTLLILASMHLIAADSESQRSQPIGLQGFGTDVRPHVCNCVTPAQENAIKRMISAHVHRLGTTMQPRTAPQLYPFNPIGGTLWQDLFVGNFVDLDSTSPGILDWDCSQFTYDGHLGHDIGIRSFQEQAIGVPVFAALDGTVINVHDGEFDMNTTAAGQPANYVILDHGDGHHSLYFHFKKGSVAVTLNQVVKAGTQLGSVGSSGNSTGPHLHFESHFNGQAYEPSAGSCRPGQSYWVNQTPIRRDLYAQEICFSNVPFSGTSGLPFDTAARVGTYSVGTKTVYFRFILGNQPANSTYRIRFRRPDGVTSALDVSGDFNSNPFYRQAWWWYSYFLNFDVTGQWHVLIDINGSTLIDAPLDIVASDANIVNRPPNPITAVLDPVNYTINDAIFARVQSSLLLRDPDYDIVRYRYQWTVNGVSIRDVTTAGMADAIPKGSASVTDSVICTITPSDGKASGPSIQISGPLSVASSAIGAPNPAEVSQTMAFTAMAKGGIGAIAYSWDFGDGSPITTGASVAHAYVVVGTYTAIVTVTDSTNAMVTSAVMVSVYAPPVVGSGIDSDGDGFSDSFETAVGTLPSDASSTPTGTTITVAGIQTLIILKASIKLNFAKPAGNDLISFSGTVPVPAGFNPTLAKSYYFVGGVIKTLALTAKGSGVSGGDSVKVTLKTTKGVVQANPAAKYSINFKKGTFAATLLNAGLTNNDGTATVMVPFTFIYNNIVYQKTQTMIYTGKKGKTGSAK